MRFFRVLVLSAVLGISLTGPGAAQSTQSTESFQAEVAALMKEDRFVLYISENFPADFNDTIRKFDESMSSEQARTLGFELTQGIRQRNATNVFAASESKIKDSVRQDIKIARALLESGVTDVCREFLMGGQGFQEHLTRNHKSLYDQKNIALYAAIVDGRGKRPLRSVAADEDWATMAEYWLSNGGTTEMLNAVANPYDVGASFYCSSFISFSETIIANDGEAADRILTEMVFGAAIG